MTIEQTAPYRPEVAWLLDAHERDMAERYPGGSWEGTGGRKDMVWLAWSDDHRPVGIVALRALAHDRVEVKHLYVVPEARRTGVASALMDAFETEAGRRGAEIVLETGTAQPEALELYRRRGYVPRDRYDGADVDGARSRFLTRR